MNISHPVRNLLGLSALVLAFPWAADAAPPAKETKKFTKQESEVQATQSKLTKPEAPPVQKKETGPVLTLDQFVEQKAKQIQKIVDQQIQKMQSLIKVTQDDDREKPDLYFRIAELYAEKQRFYSFEARALDQKIFEAPASDKSRLKSQQAAHEAAEKKWLLKAVEAYIGATAYKKYDRMDEVLFKLAYLLTSVKREEQARDFFHRLIKDHPNSKYIPDAYLSFAEYFFGKGEIDAALKFYEKVEQFPKSSVWSYAFYKKGWCYVNLGDHKKALEIFVKVVEDARAGKGSGNKAQRAALEKEAKKDIVKAYAHVGGPDKAWEFFQRTGGDFAPKMIESLAELYWEQGKFGDSSRVYRKIISMNMESPRICEWQNKIVRNTLSEGNKRDQVQEIQRLGTVFDRMREMKSLKKEVMEECQNSYHDTAKELALIWHKEAQKTQNPDTYQLTKFLYKEYLDHFQKEKGSYDMAFFYGELLFKLENWREAAEQYTKVVEMSPSGKHTKEAAYAAVISWKNALNVDDDGMGDDMKQMQEKYKKEKKHEPIPLPEYQQKMLAAFDTYIKYVPDAPELVNIKYRKARIFYEYNHYEEAAKYFADIVEKHVKHELALYSANLLLDSLNAVGKTKEVVRWVDRFLEIPELMKDASFGKEMTSLKSDTYAMEAKNYEKVKNYKECGRSMEASADTLPEHAQHPERLWDAGVCYQNAHLIGQALRMRVALIKAHPKNPLAQRALFQVASGYHQLAFYTKAADHYEEFANKFPGEKKAVVALGNATAFRIGLGESDRAIADMNTFIRFYGTKKPQDAAGVFFQMGDVFEKQKKMDDLTKHLDAYLKKWGPHGGIDKQILAHFRMGEIAWKESCKQGGVNGACIEIKRVAASGKEKAFHDENVKRKKAGKKLLKEPKRTQCGPPTKSKVVIFDREKAATKRAQDHFATVIKLWNKGEAAKKVPGKDAGEQQARLGAAAYAVAGAAFYQAELEYEAFLRVKFPEGLDFQQPSSYDSKKKQDATKKKFEESQKKFTSYLNDKQKVTVKLVGDPTAKLKGMYENVLDFKVAHWTIASAARIGQVWQNFTDQLYTAEIPKDLKEQDEWGNRPREIFCDALVDKAEPIESKAVTGFEVCLKAATNESWFNEWSRLCEVELNQMQPSDYPLASEARPEAGYVATTMTPADLVSELPGAEEATAAPADGQQ